MQSLLFFGGTKVLTMTSMMTNIKQYRTAYMNLHESQLHLFCFQMGNNLPNQ